MKKLLVLLILMGGAGYGWFWYQGNLARAEAAPPATVPVGRGTVEVSVLATGTIESEHLVSVIARETGQIEEIVVTLGQQVKKGDVLARLEASDQKNALLRAEADLRQIAAQAAAKRAGVEQARLTLERAQQLADRELGSQGELEAAQAAMLMGTAELEGLDAQRAGAEVTRAAAELSLARTTILAPSDGTVIALIASEGQNVVAGQDSALVLKLADLTAVVASVEVSEADVIRVLPGQAARLSLIGDPGASFPAEVRLIEPAPTAFSTSTTAAQSSEAVYYNAVLDIPNLDPKIRVGMTVQASIVLDQSADVLVLTSSLLGARSEDGTYAVPVYDPASGKTTTQVVKVGLNNNVTAEIIDGLKEGELVVADQAAGGSSAAVSMRRPPGMGF